MKGGIQIEGDEITIYKKVTKIKTSNQTEIAEITELEVNEEEFLEINESIYFNQEGSKAFLEQFKPVIERLKHQGYIGEEPLKHWKKNGKLCKLDIINPDITIEDRLLKHVTPAMEDLFKRHVDRFHQVAMDEESIPRIAFLVLGGLYEWLVMPFVYIDDILVFLKNEKEHSKHLERMLKICEDNGLVLSPTKIKIAVSTVDFLGAVIGEGTIKLQPHIIKKIMNFNKEELKIKKGLRSFLGILNYARTHIPKLGILLMPLYEKNDHGDKRMKPSDYDLVKKIKEQVQNLPDLEIPPENERICAYASGKFSTTQSTIDAEINACINTLEKLKIYYLDKQEVTLRTDCQAIISFYNKANSNKSSRVRWIKFADAITRTCVKINIEHIEGKHNTLADSLSRLVNLCFAECTGEMKELAVAALYSVEEVLQSPNAFQKNMKITCEEVMKISNHFQESSQKLSSHIKNQEHYTDATSLKPNKPQSEWINLMHGDQSFKTLNCQQQKKQSKQCETYKQSYNAKPKYALDNQPKTTTGPIKEKMFEFKTRKPEESSSSWKPWHRDWDATKYNFLEDDASNDDNKYRYNKKGFLEDDDARSDDSVFIVDPGWDDYCLQELKLNRPVPLFPEARRARM
nr:ORFIII-like polyprotein [Tanacetum cinerariifolium]